jgi:ATP-dependent DNA ligase
MLARSGRLPTSGDYTYELKWDGFRAIVSRERQEALGSCPAS